MLYIDYAMIKQRTIKNSVSASGVGLHSGVKVYLTLRASPPDTGIVFCRSDLGETASIYVSPESVGETHLHTTIMQNGIKVATIEHLMSAIAGLGIDNLEIDIFGEEVPIMDGSASHFIFLLISAGIVEQKVPKKFIKVKESVDVEKDGKYVKFRPHDNFELKFSMDFDHPFLKQQQLSASVSFSSETYIKEVSRARTFGFMRDIEYLKTLGLARGASLDNAVGIEENCIANESGLRYEDEFVKHKILDAIGDLFVAGHILIGKYEAFKSGHELNNMAIRHLLKTQDAWEYVTFEDNDLDCPIQYDLSARV